MLQKKEALIAEAFRHVQDELRQTHSQSVQDSVGIYLTLLREKIGDLLSANSRKFDKQSFDEACETDAPPPQPTAARQTRVA